MKVSPYYSTNPTDPDVYHDHDDCQSGKQIPPRYKEYGTPRGYSHCEHCAALG